MSGHLLKIINNNLLNGYIQQVLLYKNLESLIVQSAVKNYRKTLAKVRLTSSAEKQHNNKQFEHLHKYHHS
jgi:hypothetical protein